MPIQNINGKYRWGENGKLYDTRKEVLKQMRAIKASQGELTKNKSDKQKRLEKKQEEENKLKKQEDLKNIVENIENLIESYKDSNKLDIKDIINDEEFKDFEVYNMENFDKYKEIFIIGLPGSGKTTISEKISKKYNIPVYHLDNLWDKRFMNDSMSDEEVDEKVNKFLQDHKKPIIFEGILPVMFGYYDYFKNKPIIIINTNKLLSTYRYLNRDYDNLIDKIKGVYTVYDNANSIEKDIKRFKKELGLDINSLSESYNPYITNNTFSRNGITYDVDKLIKLTYKNKPVLFNINLLKEFLKIIPYIKTDTKKKEYIKQIYLHLY